MKIRDVINEFSVSKIAIGKKYICELEYSDITEMVVTRITDKNLKNVYTLKLFTGWAIKLPYSILTCIEIAENNIGVRL